jgi:hypothetical protein
MKVMPQLAVVKTLKEVEDGATTTTTTNKWTGIKSAAC